LSRTDRTRRAASLSTTTAVLALVLATAAPVAAQGQPATPAEFEAQARRILAGTPLVDGHNDLAENLLDRFDNHLGAFDLAAGTHTLAHPLHTDIPRLRRGAVGGVFFAAFVPPSLEGAAAVPVLFEQIDVIRRMAERYPQAFVLATSAAEVEQVHSSGRIATLIGIENGQAIGNSLAVLRQAYGAGARYMTLTHWKSTAWADAGTDAPRHGGLSSFGREVVREMQRLGMLVDLSHVSDDTMRGALAIAEAPVIFSHSSARALCNHPRNVPDEILRRVTANHGIVMVNFAPSFVSEEVRLAEAPLEAEWTRLDKLHPGDQAKVEEGVRAWRLAHPTPKATLAQVVDHVDHIRRVAGIDHVGLGSDFDGIGETPVGLEDVSCYPALVGELLRRGYSERDVRKVAGENILRVMREAERAAARLQRQRPPSDARIGELDAPPAATPSSAVPSH
jgi:membrane dipeptidase